MESKLKIKITELNQLFDEFLDSKNLKPNSLRAYETDLDYFAQFYAAEKFEFSELKREQLLTWLKQFPVRAANRRGTNIRKFLLWLEEYKGFDIDREFHLPWQFHDPAPVKPDLPIDLEDNEFYSLFSDQSLSLTKRAILGLLLTTGASLEELSCLQWQNLNLSKLSFVSIGNYGRERVIPLEKEVASILKALKKSFIPKPAAEDSVFMHERSFETISGSYMAMIVRRVTKKILGKEISPTELQEYAKKRILSKNNLNVALEILGKKKAVSIVRVDENNVDIEELRRIHTEVFS
ncbi:MAG: hypothetical protein QNJ31_05615 [Candidatus Caenarcaniphilales bacterium]|nr:hypothetical protein [Candidatus Caenarcaniphilales bacterium]